MYLLVIASHVILYICIYTYIYTYISFSYRKPCVCVCISIYICAALNFKWLFTTEIDDESVQKEIKFSSFAEMWDVCCYLNVAVSSLLHICGIYGAFLSVFWSVYVSLRTSVYVSPRTCESWITAKHFLVNVAGHESCES